MGGGALGVLHQVHDPEHPLEGDHEEPLDGPQGELRAEEEECQCVARSLGAGRQCIRGTLRWMCDV